jgi:alkanesulfonate monooxygenase SsuD/methylene tetrahydromethanopterin reductase-like flavin-dependent oxidoreductase (luciferase family)
MQDALALLREVSGRKDRRNAAVALASMVREGTALPALVTRFIELEQALVSKGVSQKQFGEADALECVSCAGTPAEVVETVRALSQEIARDRDPARRNVAIAVAFAKRFTY